MRSKEYYYTNDSYDSSKLGPFINHIDDFLNGGRSLPVTKSKIEFTDTDIFMTFSDDLMWEALINHNTIKKPYKAAIKYGFRRFTRGDRWGVFYIKEEETKLLSRIPKLIEENLEAITQDLYINKQDIDTLEPVKIEWYNKENKNIIGLYNKDNQRIIFLDSVI